jgi:hypothetical protein
MAITASNKWQWSIGASRICGWPITINFLRLPGRIYAMKDDLDKLLNTTEAREKDIMWVRFVESLKMAKTSMKTFAKGKSIPPKIFNSSRPG